MDPADTLTGLHHALDALNHDALASLDAEGALALVRDLEAVGRRLSAVQIDLAGVVERSGAYGVDGHRTAKAALVHLGRISGAEAHRRVHTARAMRMLPQVAASFSAGRIPVEMAQAIGRAVANPRVTPYLDSADPVFAEQATEESHEAFVAWLGEWERLADADGAEQLAETAHRHRRVTLVQNRGDGSWLLRGQFGPLQGAALSDVLTAFESAECLADHEEAKRRTGVDTTTLDLERSASQRRADALVAMAAVAAGASTGRRRRAVPLVNVVVDQCTFDEALCRAAGDRRSAGRSRPDPTSEVDRRICATATGHPVAPNEVVAAALVGHVRRVVIDDDGRVIDLGRRRRLFTGGAREAAVVQAVLDERGPMGCVWASCHAPPAALQVDHRTSWTRGGATQVPNSTLLCGHHNRLKESGYQPVRGPDGRWTFRRPDGTEITPPV